MKTNALWCGGVRGAWLWPLTLPHLLLADLDPPKPALSLPAKGHTLPERTQILELQTHTSSRASDESSLYQQSHSWKPAIHLLTAYLVLVSCTSKKKYM